MAREESERANGMTKKERELEEMKKAIRRMILDYESSAERAARKIAENEIKVKHLMNVLSLFFPGGNGGSGGGDEKTNNK